MATFIWYLIGSSDTTLEATDILQFAGASFDSAITVGAYNDSTHVESSVGANDSSANTPNNVKFVSQTGGTGGDSQADWGDGTEDIDQILTTECTLKINFSHGVSVITTGAKFYAYDGTTPATAPVDVTVKGAEQGDANFTDCGGSGSAITITDDTTGTSHDYYVLLSVSPDSVGEKDFAWGIELTYQ